MVSNPCHRLSHNSGQVSAFQLIRGKNVRVWLDDIHQYNYLSHSCSEQSYYQCLSSELASKEDCERHGGLCDAVSLPSVSFHPCPTTAAYNCSLTAFWAAFDNEILCKTKKSCRTMEYRLHNMQWEEGSSVFEYYFSYGLPDPTASNERLINPYKTVHTQYLVWSEFTLIAYVGGMMGLTIGFSLPGLWQRITVAWSLRPKNKSTLERKIYPKKGTFLGLIVTFDG